MDIPGSMPEQAQVAAEPAVASLAMAEMFALWAVRLWVSAYRGGGNLLPQLRHGFTLAGMPRAWLELDEFMTRLLGSVKRPLDIRAVATSSISCDEDGMLRWLAGLQRGELPPADCAHLRAIAVPGARLAVSFSKAGLQFRNAPAGAMADAPSEAIH
ncbi:MAG: hypothetical protein AB7R90_01885 [Reyranellaceae bacterium]